MFLVWLVHIKRLSGFRHCLQFPVRLAFPACFVFSTFHDVLGSSDDPVTPPYRETKFEAIGIIIGSVVGVLILGFCLVDLLCCKMNDAGWFYFSTRTSFFSIEVTVFKRQNAQSYNF